MLVAEFQTAPYRGVVMTATERIETLMDKSIASINVGRLAKGCLRCCLVRLHLGVASCYQAKVVAIATISWKLCTVNAFNCTFGDRN